MAERGRLSVHETYVGDNPPTTNQLFRLASLAMSAANAKKVHRPSPIKPRAHYSIQEAYYYNEAAPMLYDDYPTEIRHRMAVRIGRRTLDNIPLREWSLKFFDTYWYEQPEGRWSGIRTQYRFEWERDTVTLAERRLTIVPQTHRAELYDYLENATVHYGMTDLLSAEMEMSQITKDDCEELIADAANYYSQRAEL